MAGPSAESTSQIVIKRETCKQVSKTWKERKEETKTKRTYILKGKASPASNLGELARYSLLGITARRECIIVDDTCQPMCER